MDHPVHRLEIVSNPSLFPVSLAEPALRDRQGEDDLGVAVVVEGGVVGVGQAAKGGRGMAQQGRIV